MIINKKILDYCRYSTNQSINKIVEKYKDKENYKVGTYKVSPYKNYYCNYCCNYYYKNEYYNFYSTLRHTPFLIFLSLTSFLFTNLLKREIK